MRLAALPIAVAVAALVGATSCTPAASACRGDDDCPLGTQCTNDGECQVPAAGEGEGAVAEGEGTAEGEGEGAAVGEGEGEGEGAAVGEGEGASDGEGAAEGEGEGAAAGSVVIRQSDTEANDTPRVAPVDVVFSVVFDTDSAPCTVSVDNADVPADQASVHGVGDHDVVVTCGGGTISDAVVVTGYTIDVDVPGVATGFAPNAFILVSWSANGVLRDDIECRADVVYTSATSPAPPLTATLDQPNGSPLTLSETGDVLLDCYDRVDGNRLPALPPSTQSHVSVTPSLPTVAHDVNVTPAYVARVSVFGAETCSISTVVSGDLIAVASRTSGSPTIDLIVTPSPPLAPAANNALSVTCADVDGDNVNTSGPVVSVYLGNPPQGDAFEDAALDEVVLGTVAVNKDVSTFSLQRTVLISGDFNGNCLGNAKPSTMAVNELRKVLGSFGVRQCDATGFVFSAQKLVSVGGDLTITPNRLMQTVALPELTSADNVTIGGSDTLDTVSLPKLASARSLAITGATKLGAELIIDVASLTSVPDNLVISNDRSLQRLNGVASITGVGGHLSIQQDPSLPCGEVVTFVCGLSPPLTLANVSTDCNIDSACLAQ